MKHVFRGVLALLLAAPAVWAEDKPKDEKKPQTPREEFTALVKDLATQRSRISREAQKAEGEEREKLFQKYRNLGQEYAEKIYALAEKYPKDPVASDAIFWVAQMGSGSSVHAKAMDKVSTFVMEMPLNDLSARLRMLPGTTKLLEAVFQRAEKEEKDPAAPNLLVWVAMRGPNSPIGKKATDRVIEKYSTHEAVVQLFAMIGRGANGEEKLKGYLEKSSSDRIKGLAALSLGRMIRSKSDRLGGKPEESDKLAAEAEKYLVMVVDQFGKDDAGLKKDAQRELNILRHLRVGKVALDISGPDLDDKKFKLSDYRGKVVLLDFWGNW